MQEVTFEVETITPLFLAGADQATAESYTFLHFVFGSSNHALPSSFTELDKKFFVFCRSLKP